MNIEEMKKRMQQAAKNIDFDELEGVEIVEAPEPEQEQDSFADYWAGSVCQSYVDAIERGDFVTRNLDK